MCFSCDSIIIYNVYQSDFAIKYVISYLIFYRREGSSIVTNLKRKLCPEQLPQQSRETINDEREIIHGIDEADYILTDKTWQPQ